MPFQALRVMAVIALPALTLIFNTFPKRSAYALLPAYAVSINRPAPGRPLPDSWRITDSNR